MARADRRKRRRLDAPEPLEQVLERAGENRFAKKQLPMPLAVWRAAVGPRIADRARPVALERDVLVVKVVSSVWANELSMLAPQLIAKLAEKRIVVKSLKFRVGPLDVIEGMPQRRDYRKVPPPAKLDADLTRSLDRVEDDDLRAAIEGAARASLAWQQKPPSRK
jgi:predicted nucleic acid-binding Zn ribbon protein